MAQADELLARSPEIQKVDVIASKMPAQRNAPDSLTDLRLRGHGPLGAEPKAVTRRKFVLDLRCATAQLNRAPPPPLRPIVVGAVRVGGALQPPKRHPHDLARLRFADPESATAHGVVPPRLEDRVLRTGGLNADLLRALSDGARRGCKGGNEDSDSYELVHGHLLFHTPDARRLGAPCRSRVLRVKCQARHNRRTRCSCAASPKN
jgi:hypothetical protein